MASLAEAGLKMVRKAQAGAGKRAAKISASRGPCATITRKYGVACNIDGIWKQETQASNNDWQSAMSDPGIAQRWVEGYTIGISGGTGGGGR